MTFYYTSRATYDKSFDDGTAWDRYLESCRLTRLIELVSVDTLLNEVLVDQSDQTEEDLENIVIDKYNETGFFKTQEYVLKKTPLSQKFNLLSVVIEPTIECNNIILDGYEFVGYDLLDMSYEISALVNCSGFNETFLPKDLNTKGLIDIFSNAVDIQRKLLENNPEEYHADTNIIAIWRHKTIGR